MFTYYHLFCIPYLNNFDYKFNCHLPENRKIFLKLAKKTQIFSDVFYGQIRNEDTTKAYKDR